MARLFTSGFEVGDYLDFNYLLTTGMSVITTAPRSGTYHGRIFNAASYFGHQLATPVDTLYARVGFRTTINTLMQRIISFVVSDATYVDLRLGTDGKFYMTRNGTQIGGTSSWQISLNTYYLLELYVYLHDTLGEADFRIDGVSGLASPFSGDTKPDTGTTFTHVQFLGTVSADKYFDDLAINDTTGAVDNSWCGEGKIIAMMPDSAGTTTQWTPSTGANWECVDERPPNGDSDYNSVATDGNVDLFNLTASGLSGMTINRIVVKGTARKESAGTDQVRLKIRTNSTDYNGTDVNVLTTYTRLQEMWQQNPFTTAAWTPTELDALQAGYESRT